MTRPRGLRRDDGSVSVLVVGFAAVLVALIAVVTDASTAYLARRAVVAAADAAALAAAEGVDRDRLYDGSLDTLPLSAAEARRRARQHLVRTGLVSRYPGASVTAVRLDGTRSTVTVTLRATARLPFSRVLGSSRGTVTITASASARSPLR